MDTTITKRQTTKHMTSNRTINTTYEAIVAVVNRKEHVTLHRYNQQNPDYNFIG